LSLYKKLFQQTAIYGLATVLPRMLSFILVRLHTDLMPTANYGEVTMLLAYMIFLNVLLSYGMETSFFRFINKDNDNKSVIQTATISIFWSSLVFLTFALLCNATLAQLIEVETHFVTYAIWILVFDALSVIPFAKLRFNQQPIRFAIVKFSNVLLNLSLNVFLLYYLPKLVAADSHSIFSSIYVEDFQIGYIFIANLIASLSTLLFFIPEYIKLNWKFDYTLWKQMLKYGSPILVAGLAFGVNEHLDKILLAVFDVPKADIGAYGACYKIGLFMVLYRTAYTLGIEPFFFNYAKEKDATATFALVTKYFVIIGSFMQLIIIVFADVLKQILIDNSDYWYAMNIVPLIIVANFFLGIYTNLSVWYKLTDRTKMGMYISLVGAAVTLLLNFLLIPILGFTGSAIATIAAYGIMMVISYKLGQKAYPIPYESKKIGIYLATSIILSGFSFYVPILRETYIFGIVSILFFGYYIYRNEKQLILKIIKRK
jgi:O-antigen/teichoic acid export membrane protein